MPVRTILVVGSIIVVSTGISLWMAERLPFVRMAERWTSDYRIATLLAPEPQHPDIVIFTLTEDTLARFPYRSPIDRRFLADLLKTLQARGARAIAVDVLFDQPTEPEKDEELRQTLAGLSVPLAVGYADREDGETETQQRFLDGFLPRDLRAMANLSNDPYDGTVRAAYGGRVTADEVFVPGLGLVLAKKMGIDVPASGFDIAWHGSPAPDMSPFRKLPAHAFTVLPAEWVKNKVVLVGSDLSLTDRHRTPFSTAHKGKLTSMAGVEIHAHVLAQLMDGRSAPGNSWGVNPAITAAAALLGLMTAMADFRMGLKLAVAGLNIVSLWVVGFFLFHRFGIMVPLVAPTSAFAAALTFAETYGNRRYRQQRKFIHDAFTRYVASDVVEQLIREPEKLCLRGERREITMLFTDVTGFSRMAERIDGPILGVLLNSYLGAICDIVLATNGTVVEFLGDAVFAIFGAPMDDPDHSRRALAAARAIDTFAEIFSAGPDAARWDWGETRIGVHSGVVLIGNFGSERRFKYVPVGSAVNTAARIEGLNKFFGTRICVSGETLPDDQRDMARPLGRVVVQGREDAIEVFELLTENTLSSEYYRHYRLAYELLDQAATAEAAAHFEELAAEKGDDLCVGLHLARIRAGHRDTVIVMEEK